MDRLMLYIVTDDLDAFTKLLNNTPKNLLDGPQLAYRAITRNRLEMIKLLQQNGLPLGPQAVYFARQQGRQEIINYLSV